VEQVLEDHIALALPGDLALIHDDEVTGDETHKIEVAGNKSIDLTEWAATLTADQKRFDYFSLMHYTNPI
jgi:hypothetical protein